MALEPCSAVDIDLAIKDLQRASTLSPRSADIQNELQSALLRRRAGMPSEIIANRTRATSSSSARKGSAASSNYGVGAPLPTSSSSSSPYLGRSRHVGTEVGVDAEAEVDDAAQDPEIAVLYTSQFSDFKDEDLDKVAVNITDRIANSCSLAIKNKRRGMVSECNKLIARVNLLKRDLLLFVRRARRYRRIVIFRKQLDWLVKMSTASMDEIVNHWNIDITDVE